MPTGFLGTRADALIDLTLVFFVAAPFLMSHALRLAARRRHRAHRNFQAGLLAAGLVAVLLLEGSIRFGGAMAAYSESAYYQTPLLVGLFYVHLGVAIPTFIGWSVLAGVSWPRFSRVLPGDASAGSIGSGGSSRSLVCCSVASPASSCTSCVTHSDACERRGGIHAVSRATQHHGIESPSTPPSRG